MAQQVEALATNPNELSSIPRTILRKGRTKLPSHFHMYAMDEHPGWWGINKVSGRVGTGNQMGPLQD